jgi:hypothetical protein
VAYVDRLSSASVRQQIRSKVDDNSKKDDSLNCVLAFAVVGMFLSILSIALTPFDWLQGLYQA